MRGKGGARRPGLLAPHFLAVGGVNLLGLVAQDPDLFLRKAAGQEQIAFLSELPKLLSVQLHRGFLSLTWTTAQSTRGFSAGAEEREAAWARKFLNSEFDLTGSDQDKQSSTALP